MLYQKIESSLKEALREANQTKLNALRMLKAAILNKEKEKRYQLSKESPELESQELEEKSTLDDEEITEVIFSIIKKSKQAIVEFEKGNRQDLVKKEKGEIEVLNEYLPKQLSEEKIRKIAEDIISETGAESIKGMGKVMSLLMPKLKGQADGSLVSKVVRELLS